MITLARSIGEPYAFEGAYKDCFADPLTAMDKRHVYLLHAVLSCWRWSSTLELGSYNGASSTAFIEAVNDGRIATATFCEVAPRPSLLSVLSNAQSQWRVRLTQQPSWAALDTSEDFDFIFVDASHDLASVSLELAHLIRRRPLCVMAHDTNATAAGYSKCEGAKLLKDTLMTEPGYFCMEDAARREGERTDRGLFFATTNRQLWDDAGNAFARFS